MNRFLMSVETVKIKDFIFSTNKLKLIRGASYLLDYLNQIEIPAILEKYKIESEDIIYIGAGNAKFFVDSKEKADNIASDIKKLYKEEAPNSKILIAFKEVTFNGIESTGDEKLWDSIDKLADKIAIEKSKGFPIVNIDLPFVKKCPLCEKNPVLVSTKNLEEDLLKLNIIGDEKKDFYNNLDIDELKNQIEILTDRNGYICEECLKKLIYSMQIKAKKSGKDNILSKVGFYKTLEENKIDIELKKSLDDYGDENSFIGLMYSDGDGLGDFLKNIKNIEQTEKEYLEFLKEFSKKLDETTKNSLLKALIKISKNSEKLTGEFLIVGGDDVCAVLNSKEVLKISKEFQEIFEKEMEKYTTAKGIDNRITSSCGVVIAKAKAPMYHLFDQALALQKNAKAKRYKNKILKTGYIDFQVINSEACIDLKSFREKIHSKENPVMERPYSIGKESESKEFQTLLDLIIKLKSRDIDFPKNKLRSIYELKLDKTLEEFEKKDELVNILSKMEPRHIEFIDSIENVDYLNENEFNKLFSNIFDILEIYDFVDGGER